jgi:hypothetical protein
MGRIDGCCIQPSQASIFCTATLFLILERWVVGREWPIRGLNVMRGIVDEDRVAPPDQSWRNVGHAGCVLCREELLNWVLSYPILAPKEE